MATQDMLVVEKEVKRLIQHGSLLKRQQEPMPLLAKAQIKRPPTIAIAEVLVVVAGMVAAEMNTPILILVTHGFLVEVLAGLIHLQAQVIGQVGSAAFSLTVVPLTKETPHSLLLAEAMKQVMQVMDMRE
jgi:type IV secretory pathway VirB3-like protein